MFCYKCGTKCEDNVSVCSNCGTVLKSEPQEVKHNLNTVEDESVLYIILSILSLFCCNQITGIISLIFAIMATSDYNHGDYKSAQEKWKICKITLLVGVALVVGAILLALAIWGTAVFGVFAMLF